MASCSLFSAGLVPDDADVLLSCGLLRLNEPGGSVEADDEAARDLGIQGARVASLIDLEDALDPGDDLVGRGIGGFVEVYDAVLEVLCKIALEGRGAAGDGRVVGGQNIHSFIVL